MRDFLPGDVRASEYVIGVIKAATLRLRALENSVENIETLTGKYGEEGNQLILQKS